MNIQHILAKLHITALSEMQQHTAEALLRSDGDVVLLSPTGTGKTLAYLLPLAQLIDQNSKLKVQSSPSALVITPSRELAQQSHQVLQRMSCGLRSMACYGGRPTMDEHRLIRQVEPHIIFGTPGRLCDHLDKGNIAADSVSYLVIDEFDKCLQLGFQSQMQHLIQSLSSLERRILLSATNADQIPLFVNMSRRGTLINFLPDANDDDPATPRYTVYRVTSPDKDKLHTLLRLLLSFGSQSTIVFLNYRDSVQRVNDYLQQHGFITSHLHGALDQRQREEQLYQFSNGSTNVLVATDLASRGLDIPDIQNIVHYHLPETPEGYTHRVGRTARWDATGRTFFLLAPGEHIPDYVEGTPESYAIPDAPESPAPPLMATLYIGKGKNDKLSRGDIVGFLCKTCCLSASDIGRIDVRDRYSYVAIRRTQLPDVLRLAKGAKIKGLKTLFDPLR